MEPYEQLVFLNQHLIGLKYSIEINWLIIKDDLPGKRRHVVKPDIVSSRRRFNTNDTNPGPAPPPILCIIWKPIPYKNTSF